MARLRNTAARRSALSAAADAASGSAGEGLPSPGTDAMTPDETGSSGIFDAAAADSTSSATSNHPPITAANVMWAIVATAVENGSIWKPNDAAAEELINFVTRENQKTVDHWTAGAGKKLALCSVCLKLRRVSRSIISNVPSCNEHNDRPVPRSMVVKEHEGHLFLPVKGLVGQQCNWQLVANIFAWHRITVVDGDGGAVPLTSQGFQLQQTRCRSAADLVFSSTAPQAVTNTREKACPACSTLKSAGMPHPERHLEAIHEADPSIGHASLQLLCEKIRANIHILNNSHVENLPGTVLRLLNMIGFRKIYVEVITEERLVSTYDFQQKKFTLQPIQQEIGSTIKSKDMALDT